MEVMVIEGGAERVFMPSLDGALGSLDHGPGLELRGACEQLLPEGVVGARRDAVLGAVVRLVLYKVESRRYKVGS